MWVLCLMGFLFVKKEDKRKMVCLYMFYDLIDGNEFYFFVYGLNKVWVILFKRVFFEEGLIVVFSIIYCWCRKVFI